MITDWLCGLTTSVALATLLSIHCIEQDPDTKNTPGRVCPSMGINDLLTTGSPTPLAGGILLTKNPISFLLLWVHLLKIMEGRFGSGTAAAGKLAGVFRMLLLLVVIKSTVPIRTTAYPQQSKGKNAALLPAHMV